jgi:hypothetical protein
MAASWHPNQFPGQQSDKVGEKSEIDELINPGHCWFATLFKIALHSLINHSCRNMIDKLTGANSARAGILIRILPEPN